MNFLKRKKVETGSERVKIATDIAEVLLIVGDAICNIVDMEFSVSSLIHGMRKPVIRDRLSARISECMNAGN